MPKISVIGICGNSVFMGVDHFHEVGETIAASEIFEEIGGKGINQAVAARRMGAEVSFLGAVGNDENGRKCIDFIENNKIKNFVVTKEGNATPLAFILTDKSGNNQVTVHRGAELEICDLILFEKEIAESDVLLIQHEVPEVVNRKAVEIARKYNTKVILNPAPPRMITDDVAQSVCIVTPNEQEKKALDAEKFKCCITTLGDKGCAIDDREIIPAIKTKAVDTTGAGDTFNGVLAVCIAEGMDLKKSCRYAVAASGISVGRRYFLNAIPYRDEIERKIKDE